MTPSKESLQAVNNLYLAGILFQVDMEDGDCVPADKSQAATLIDTAYAEHRERVKRVADCAEAASICMAASAKAFDRLEMDQSGDMLRAVIKSLDTALAALKEHHDPVA